MDFQDISRKGVNLNAFNNSQQKFKKEELRSGDTGRLPGEVMEMILSLLDDESLQKAVSSDQFLNKKTINAAKRREIYSITNEIQILVEELETIIKNTQEEKLTNSCEIAKKELLQASAGSTISASQNLIQIKRSSHETRNIILKALIKLDDITLKQLESKVTNKSIVLRNVFPYLMLLKNPLEPENTETYEILKKQGKFSSVEAFIADFLPTVEILDHTAAIKLKYFLLNLAAKSQFHKLVYLISQTLPINQEFDELRIRVCELLRDTGLIENAISVWNNITTPNTCISCADFLKDLIVKDRYPEFVYLVSESLPIDPKIDICRTQACLQLTNAGMIEKAISVGNKIANPSALVEAMVVIVKELIAKDNFEAALQITENLKGWPKTTIYGITANPTSFLKTICFLGYVKKGSYELALNLLSSISEQDLRISCDDSLTETLILSEKSPFRECMLSLFSILKIEEEYVENDGPPRVYLFQKQIVERLANLDDSEIKKLENAFPSDLYTGFFASLFPFARLLKTNNTSEVSKILEPLKKYCYNTNLTHILNEIKNPEIRKQVTYWFALQFADICQKDYVDEALHLIRKNIINEENKDKRKFYISEFLRLASKVYEPDHAIMKNFPN